MHRLLERQVKEFLGRTDGLDASFLQLLQAVSEVYSRQEKIELPDEKESKGEKETATSQKDLESERDELQSRLVELSRQAGMSEIATGVLHNVGNVLNSINVSISTVCDQLRASRVSRFVDTANLMRQNAATLIEFLGQDPKGKQIPEYLIKLSGLLAEENQALLKEMAGVTQHLEHVKQVISMQQGYARNRGVVEPLVPGELIEDALTFAGDGLTRHDVQVVKELAPLPQVRIDRHQALQILINLINNAKQAMSDVKGEKILTIRLAISPSNTERFIVQVCDSGVGITGENLTRIFSHGFTTKASGHGFGLHTSALAAKAMGGSLSVQSDGPDQGATFTVELPMVQARIDATTHETKQRRVA